MQRASYQSALQHSIDRGVTESHPCKTIRLALKASDGPRRVASVLVRALFMRRSWKSGSVSRCRLNE
jgi:L-asparaginase II